ncbi:hypothetical protein [Synoicihabitans lomoniglobus]|uniref:Uncharacterized protein n=1 Tax=Synoicihabitans lomoniglobus TaxID=2909285 RepID=A0AAF0CSV9_9BACT|nr:hypothetical protein [Opitutaceae bacterium LMO-M01]WED67457.1 hypothetical protein PXH66_11410 [Opitutaceae bacterium LMO-M01]
MAAGHYHVRSVWWHGWVRTWALAVGCLALMSVASAAVEVSPAAALQPPTEEWVKATLHSSPDLVWAEIETTASNAALVAKAKNRTDAMEGWLLVARWSRLMGTNEREVTRRWANAINSARLGHANMARDYDPPSRALSAMVSPQFFVNLISDRELSRSFFDLLTPYDYLPGVLAILDRLYQDDPADFVAYQELALAIALVFDVPPPPHWPHGQVSPELLPRTLPEPLEAFHFWVKSDRARKTLHRLQRLKASELKFVVSAAASFEDLRWAQASPQLNFSTLPGTYDAIRYRDDRADQSIFDWPGSSYTLPTILSQGGICIDQGYFASEMGKARGVPTLLFRGVGLDGRHAWFGYLDAKQKWRLDVGRYAEQQYVAGVAFDPQTWANVNDHELAFLAERFRFLPNYQQSRAWQFMAQEHLRRNEVEDAIAAAQRAVNYESRNVAAWELLLLAQSTAEWPVIKRESTMRSAARSFQRYPDLNARFMREVIAAMRERGQTSAADHEERQLARKFTVDRSDLAISQAAEMLNRTMVEDPPEVQLRVFQNALRQFGVGAGMDAFDRLVEPFFDYTLGQARRNDAGMVLTIAHRVLQPPAGSQFAQEIQRLAQQLR